MKAELHAQFCREMRAPVEALVLSYHWVQHRKVGYFLLLDPLMILYGREAIFRFLGKVGVVVFPIKTNPETNNTIYSRFVTHPKHHKITDLFLTYWATKKWFLIHPCFMCKPKKDISSTCASVSLTSNSFGGDREVFRRHSDLVVMCLQLDQRKLYRRTCDSTCKGVCTYLVCS